MQHSRSPSYLPKPYVFHKGQVGMTVSMPQLGFEDFVLLSISPSKVYIYKAKVEKIRYLCLLSDALHA